MCCVSTCRVTGSVSASPWGSAAGVTAPLPGGLAIRQLQDSTPGMGKLSLMRETAGAGSGIPGPGKRLGPSGSQALGHPGATGSCGRAENGVEVRRLALALVWGRKEEPCWSCRQSPWLVGGWLELGLVAAVARNAERPSTYLWLPTADRNEKRQFMVLNR